MQNKHSKNPRQSKLDFGIDHAPAKVREHGLVEGSHLAAGIQGEARRRSCWLVSGFTLRGPGYSLRSN